MPRVDELVVNFAIYEDAIEYLGMADVELPEISALTEEITGAGIAGNVEAIAIGHLEAMTLTLNFRTVTDATMRLNEPRIHMIDLRSAQQSEDTGTKKINIDDMKYILRVRPKKLAPGKVGVATTADASGEYAVTYYAIYKNGVKKLEIDQLNYIYYVDGVDYLADVRRALGK